jgi:hypothetical protein
MEFHSSGPPFLSCHCLSRPPRCHLFSTYRHPLPPSSVQLPSFHPHGPSSAHRPLVSCHVSLSLPVTSTCMIIPFTLCPPVPPHSTHLPPLSFSDRVAFLSLCHSSRFLSITSTVLTPSLPSYPFSHPP